jgi:NAD(P)-dependent dehydrogenase (short-subunit alcohol dehydrogenase family)
MGVVVITGAASGLGWAMAQRFYARGDTLLLVDRDAALLYRLLPTIYHRLLRRRFAAELPT